VVPAGAISTAARSSIVLNEARLRLPDMPMIVDICEVGRDETASVTPT
jgi:hypothetical protein